MFKEMIETMVNSFIDTFFEVADEFKENPFHSVGKKIDNKYILCRRMNDWVITPIGSNKILKRVEAKEKYSISTILQKYLSLYDI